MLSEFPTKHASSSVLLSSSFGYVLLCKLTNNGLPFKRFLKFNNVVKLITFNLVDITKANITRNLISNFAVSKHVTAIMLFCRMTLRPYEIFTDLRNLHQQAMRY